MAVNDARRLAYVPRRLGAHGSRWHAIPVDSTRSMCGVFAKDKIFWSTDPGPCVTCPMCLVRMAEWAKA